MPATIDHDKRRRAIAEIVTDIIARDGLDGVTMRNVATTAGYSTTIVTHYFSGKYELLKYTHQVAAEHAQKRVHGALARDPHDLQGCLEAMLPLDETSLRDWKIYFAFWQVATYNSDFTSQQLRATQHARDLIAITLRAQQESGLLPEAADLPTLARRLLTIIQGVAMQATLDQNGWSPARQRAFLREELRLFRLVLAGDNNA